MQSHATEIVIRQGGARPYPAGWNRQVALLLDGHEFYEVTVGISHIEEYMILSMELPSKPEELKNAVFPDVFITDYIKVYKKK